MAMCPSPRACGNAAVAWSPPATSRRRGRPPATFPPRIAHAATAPCALISRCRGPKEKHPLYRNSSSHQLAVPLPCRQLLSSAMRTSLAPTPHRRPRLHLPEHHRALEHLTDLSFLVDEHHTDPSPAHPSARPPSPPPFAPNRDPCRPGLLPGHFPAGQPDSAGEPPTMREFFPPLFLLSWAEMP
jgi:hypothetical protein